MWTETYRPKTLADMVGHPDLLEELRAAAGRGSVQHYLLHGPAGTGKTTLARALARDLNGDGWDMDYLELNASSDRGLETIRQRVVPFVRGRPWGSWRILVLDEADNLTPDAQEALRSPMETAARLRCRFVLTGNRGLEAFHPALLSRCRVWRLDPLPPEPIVHRLRWIAQQEGLVVDDNVLLLLAKRSAGDMRKAVSDLETVRDGVA